MAGVSMNTSGRNARSMECGGPMACSGHMFCPTAISTSARSCCAKQQLHCWHICSRAQPQLHPATFGLEACRAGTPSLCQDLQFRVVPWIKPVLQTSMQPSAWPSDTQISSPSGLRLFQQRDTTEMSWSSPTLASWSLPAGDRGRSSAAWRTKNTRIRAAMRASRVPAKEGRSGDGEGTNLEKYSILHIVTYADGCQPSVSPHADHFLAFARNWHAQTCQEAGDAVAYHAQMMPELWAHLQSAISVSSPGAPLGSCCHDLAT